MGSLTPQVSFVIPVLNDAENLARCLRAIAAQSASVDCEILVMDNGSIDRSPMVAGSFGADVCCIPGVRVSALRNEGIRRARGPLVALVDADNEIAPDWLSIVCRRFEDAGAAAIGRSYSAPCPGTWVQQAYDRLRGQPVKGQAVRWLATGNMVVRRSAALEVGGFDETLETCEDVDFCNRLRRHGYQIWADPRLHSTHYGDPATLSALFKGELWRGRDALRVDARGISSWADLPSMVLPVLVLALTITIAATAALSWAIDGQWLWWTVAAAMALIALTWLKVARTLLHSSEDRGRVVELWAVVLVYDLARALALAARIRHRSAVPASARVCPSATRREDRLATTSPGGGAVRTGSGVAAGAGVQEETRRATKR
jgi:GT2 family glycosyltransferase